MEKKRLDKEKKAQMHFPYQLIFSLILIAVFLFAAFFVVRHFLELQTCSQIGLFIQDLRSAVNEVWQSQEASTTISLELPSSLTYACFANLTTGMNLVGLSRSQREDAARIYDDLRVYFKYRNANFFLYPWQSACNMPTHTIEHIKFEGMANPYCFKNEKGKVAIKLTKGFDDLLVNVK